MSVEVILLIPDSSTGVFTYTGERNHECELFVTNFAFMISFTSVCVEVTPGYVFVHNLHIHHFSSEFKAMTIESTLLSKIFSTDHIISFASSLCVKVRLLRAIFFT